MNNNKSNISQAGVRLDKWLWAARFYKTRAIAKQAIHGGKVRCEGVRAKPGKDVFPGLEITLRQGFDEKTVIVQALSQQRRGASEAQLLYKETPQSQKKRDLQAEKRKSLPRQILSEGKPNKRDRRLIHQFRQTGQD